MSESLGYAIMVLIVIVFLGWFFLGTQWNVRKGDHILRWLSQGLPLIGERSTLRWLGSSVMELKIGKGKDPFRSAETLVIFEPRDVVFIWAVARLQRRRDTLVFRAQLRSAPSFEMEIFDPKGWTTRVNERTLQDKNWKKEDSAQPMLQVYHTGDSKADAATLIESLSRAGGRLARVSVHRNVPNLEIHWYLPDLQAYPARDLFAAVKQVGEQVMGS